MTPQEVIDKARKIVIKIGSNTLAKNDGTINVDFMETFASECAALISRGKQVIVVSSGAQVAGLSTISGWAHKGDIHYRQALCAIGQVELMDKWRESFGKQNLHAVPSFGVGIFFTASRSCPRRWDTASRRSGACR